MSEQGHYSCRECIDLVGLPNNINREELENAVVKTFQVTRINIGRQNFHVVHRLANQRVVIAKLTNRRDAVDVLRLTNQRVVIAKLTNRRDAVDVLTQKRNYEHQVQRISRNRIDKKSM